MLEVDRVDMIEPIFADSIFAVDISKAHIPDDVKKMSDYDLLRLIHVFRETGSPSTIQMQRFIHAKAEMLNRPQVSKHVKRNASRKTRYW